MDKIKPKPVVFKVDPNTGHLISDWWDEETADILCKLCTDCPGWRSGKKPLDCTAGNQWCG